MLKEIEDKLENFTFHIVQIKLGGKEPIGDDDHAFTFHIVQIKPANATPSKPSFSSFTFHIVQIKPVAQAVYLAIRDALHST